MRISKKNFCHIFHNFKDIQSSAETYIRFIMNSIGGKTLSPDIIGTATISGAKLFLMKDLKLIYIFQDKLIIKFYFKVTKRNANLPFLSVNFPSVCSEITSQIVCKFLQIIVLCFLLFLVYWSGVNFIVPSIMLGIILLCFLLCLE